MSKSAAITSIEAMFASGFISHTIYQNKVARIEQIAADNKMHYATKNNRYQAVVEMAKHGM